MDEKAFFAKLGSTLDSAVQKIAGFSRLSTKNVVLTDMEGNELTLEKETGVPAVGDKATPDGSFTMESGTVIVVSGGVITSIDENTPDELETAKQQLADLTAKVETLEAEKVALAAKVAEAETAKTEAVTAKGEFETAKADAAALVTELTGLKNSWKPGTRQVVGMKDIDGKIDIAAVKAAREAAKSNK